MYADPHIIEKVFLLKEWSFPKRVDGGVGGDATKARQYFPKHPRSVAGEGAPRSVWPKTVRKPRMEPRAFEEMQHIYPNL